MTGREPSATRPIDRRDRYNSQSWFRSLWQGAILWWRIRMAATRDHLREVYALRGRYHLITERILKAVCSGDGRHAFQHLHLVHYPKDWIKSFKFFTWLKVIWNKYSNNWILRRMDLLLSLQYKEHFLHLHFNILSSNQFVYSDIRKCSRFFYQPTKCINFLNSCWKNTNLKSNSFWSLILGLFISFCESVFQSFKFNWQKVFISLWYICNINSWI